MAYLIPFGILILQVAIILILKFFLIPEKTNIKIRELVSKNGPIKRVFIKYGYYEKRTFNMKIGDILFIRKYYNKDDVFQENELKEVVIVKQIDIKEGCEQSYKVIPNLNLKKEYGSHDRTFEDVCYVAVEFENGKTEVVLNCSNK